MVSRKNDVDAVKDEKPRHKVDVSSFYMSIYKVTYGEFITFICETDYQTDADKDSGSYILNIATDVFWTKKDGIN